MGMYPPELIDPIRTEVRAMGLAELTTAATVNETLATSGTILLLINSVCGCAAGGARPGLQRALVAPGPRPNRTATVFAGVDREAVTAARAHFPEYPPSSPSIVLLKNGEVAWFLHRHQIEGRTPDQIAEALRAAFASHC